jgi:hypothetical protein
MHEFGKLGSFQLRNRTTKRDRDFCSFHLQYIVDVNTSHIWYRHVGLYTICQTVYYHNHVFQGGSLDNTSIIDIPALKETFEWHDSWDWIGRASSGLQQKEIRLGWVLVAHLDVNLGVRPNDAWAGRGEILKFRHVHSVFIAVSDAVRRNVLFVLGIL